MSRITRLALALTAGTFAATAFAQQTMSIDFLGESTFRGVLWMTERDLRPVQTKVSNPNLSGLTYTADSDALSAGAPPAYNAPRRVAERLQAELGRPIIRNNYAISGVNSNVTRDGITFANGSKQLGVSAIGGRSESGVVVLNTGINDASQNFTVTTARNNYRTIINRAIRTGHKVVIIQPNYVTTGYANRLKVIFEGGADPDSGLSVTSFRNYLSGLGADFTRNVTYVSAPDNANLGVSYSATSTYGGDGVHPSAATYEKMAAAISAAVKPALTDTLEERTIAQDYILFFNRAVESGGATYWLGVLKQSGEAYVAQAMFHAAPQFRNASGGDLSSSEIVQKWYWNLFRQAPDPQGLAFWTAEINANGIGATAVKMLNVVRWYGYNIGDLNLGNGQPTTAAQATHKQLLVHRTNVGVAYGFRLKRATVDNSTMMATITTDPNSVFKAMEFK